MPTIRKRLSEEAVDAPDPRLPGRRAQRRESVVTDEIDRLEGAAPEYTDALDAAERLVELAASDVFGQLVMYRDPVTVHASRLSRPGPDLPGVGPDRLHILGGTLGGKQAARTR